MSAVILLPLALVSYFTQVRVGRRSPHLKPINHSFVKYAFVHRPSGSASPRITVLCRSLQDSSVNLVQAALPMALVTFLVFVLDFYIESFAMAKLEVHRAGKIGSVASFLAALLFAFLWDRPWALIMREWHHGTPGGDAHVLSGGTVACALFFVFGELTGCERFTPRIKLKD